MRIEIRTEYSSSGLTGRHGEHVRAHPACSCERNRTCKRTHWQGQCEGRAVVVQIRQDGSEMELCADCA